MHKPLAIALLALSLTGCSTIDAVLHPPQNVVDGLIATLTAAETAADGYVNLPLCGTVPQGALCSTVSVIHKIKIADQAAYTALKAAEKTQSQGDIAAAQTAITALQNIVSTVSGG